ncbi:MAG: hypothetical protein K1X88_10685 [Nannocystaceae bacterium]|nr:hypothetical protein [Nannocystaceae bacterium]
MTNRQRRPSAATPMSTWRLLVLLVGCGDVGGDTAGREVEGTASDTGGSGGPTSAASFGDPSDSSGTATTAATDDGAGVDTGVATDDTGDAPPARDAYRWYPALDKASIPFHAGAGPWGEARPIQEAAEPVVADEVTVASCDEFIAEMLLGAREITIGADIDCNGAVVDGNVSDVDVVIPPGTILRSFVLGSYLAGHTTSRLRFRGPTVGQHSGGQLHHVMWLAAPFDTIFDGIDCTGPGVIDGAQQAAILYNGPAGERTAITNVRGAAGSYFFIGTISDLVVTGSSFSSSIEPRGDSGQEGWVFRVIGAPGPTGNVFYDNDLRGTRYHKLRFHPSGTTGYAWVSDNNLVDMNEARILTVSQRLVSDPKGYYAGFWVERNEVWTDTNDPVHAGPDFSSDSAAYVRFEANVLHSDELTSDESLGIQDGSEAEPESPPGYPNVAIPDEQQDWSRAGNQFGAMQPAPAWRASTPGDPTQIVWDLGD